MRPEGARARAHGLQRDKACAAWFTDSGHVGPCAYGAAKLEPMDMPEWLLGLAAVVIPWCGIAHLGDWPNSCHMAVYPDGSCGVGSRADDIAIFCAKGKRREP